MQQRAARKEDPEIRQLVMEASQALALLDAGRLEELAQSCKALNRELCGIPDTALDADLPASNRALSSPHGTRRVSLLRQAREAQADMAVFARVLDATRANLHVLSRLRDLPAGRLEYSATTGPGWRALGTERGYGDN